MRTRIKKLLGRLRARGLDGLFVTCPRNISYLTGSRSRDSYLLVSPKKRVYFTDSRYTEEARRDLAGIAEVREYKPPVWSEVAREARKLKLGNLGYEDKKLSVHSWRNLSACCGDEGFLRPASGLVEELRLIKSPGELKEMRTACSIAMDCLRFASQVVSPGRTELEVAGELERFLRYRGAYASSFDIIVASGPNSSLPHHVTSERRLKEGDPVYIDMGVDYQGYRSDLTRVFFLGKIAVLVQRVYKVVTEAQKEAIRHIRPGAMAADIDSCARRYITSRGFGRGFSHALGHGVGLDVHEGPRIAPGVETRLEEGMVFTIEPAVYIPGKFGVRVEDMVLVTRNGSEVLSGSLNK